MASKNVSTTTTTTNRESCSSFDPQEQLHFVREKLLKFQSNMLSDFEQRLSRMIEDVLQDMRQQELRAHEFRQFDNPQLRGSNSGATWHNRKSQQVAESADISDSPSDVQNETRPTQQEQQQQQKQSHKPKQQQQQQLRRQLPDKVFVTRESYLTALLQVEHMRTIYHIFYIILVMFLLNNICYDYFFEGAINLGLGTFRGGLKRLHWVMGVWFLEHIFVLALYFAFRGWALVRARLQSHSEYTLLHFL